MSMCKPDFPKKISLKIDNSRQSCYDEYRKPSRLWIFLPAFWPVSPHSIEDGTVWRFCVLELPAFLEG